MSSTSEDFIHADLDCMSPSPTLSLTPSPPYPQSQKSNFKSMEHKIYLNRNNPLSDRNFGSDIGINMQGTREGW